MNALTVKIAVTLVALFGLGVATGGVAVRRIAPRPFVPAARLPVEQRWTSARLQEYRTRLDLSPEQVAAITPHFRKFGQDMRRLREDLRGRFASSVRDLNESIARELRPDQREELRDLLQESRQRPDSTARNAGDDGSVDPPLRQPPRFP